MTDSPVVVDSKEPRFYTIAEAAAILKVSEKTIRRALKSGRIPFFEVGPGSLRIPAAGLESFDSEVSA